MRIEIKKEIQQTLIANERGSFTYPEEMFPNQNERITYCDAAGALIAWVARDGNTMLFEVAADKTLQLGDVNVEETQSFILSGQGHYQLKAVTLYGALYVRNTQLRVENAIEQTGEHSKLDAENAHIQFPTSDGESSFYIADGALRLNNTRIIVPEITLVNVQCEIKNAIIQAQHSCSFLMDDEARDRIQKSIIQNVKIETDKLDLGYAATFRQCYFTFSSLSQSGDQQFHASILKSKIDLTKNQLAGRLVLNESMLSLKGDLTTLPGSALTVSGKGAVLEARNMVSQGALALEHLSGQALENPTDEKFIVNVMLKLNRFIQLKGQFSLNGQYLKSEKLSVITVGVNVRERFAVQGPHDFMGSYVKSNAVSLLNTSGTIRDSVVASGHDIKVYAENTTQIVDSSFDAQEKIAFLGGANLQQSSMTSFNAKFNGQNSLSDSVLGVKNSIYTTQDSTTQLQKSVFDASFIDISGLVTVDNQSVFKAKQQFQTLADSQISGNYFTVDASHVQLNGVSDVKTIQLSGDTLQIAANQTASHLIAFKFNQSGMNKAILSAKEMIRSMPVWANLGALYTYQINSQSVFEVPGLVFAMQSKIDNFNLFPFPTGMVLQMIRNPSSMTGRELGQYAFEIGKLAIKSFIKEGVMASVHFAILCWQIGVLCYRHLPSFDAMRKVIEKLKSEIRLLYVSISKGYAQDYFDQKYAEFFEVVEVIATACRKTCQEMDVHQFMSASFGVKDQFIQFHEKYKIADAFWRTPTHTESFFEFLMASPSRAWEGLQNIKQYRPDVDALYRQTRASMSNGAWFVSRFFTMNRAEYGAFFKALGESLIRRDGEARQSGLDFLTATQSRVSSVLKQAQSTDTPAATSDFNFLQMLQNARLHFPNVMQAIYSSPFDPRVQKIAFQAAKLCFPQHTHFSLMGGDLISVVASKQTECVYYEGSVFDLAPVHSVYAMYIDLNDKPVISGDLSVTAYSLKNGSELKAAWSTLYDVAHTNTLPKSITHLENGLRRGKTFTMNGQQIIHNMESYIGSEVWSQASTTHYSGVNAIHSDAFLDHGQTSGEQTAQLDCKNKVFVHTGHYKGGTVLIHAIERHRLEGSGELNGISVASPTLSQAEAEAILGIGSSQSYQTCDYVSVQNGTLQFNRAHMQEFFTKQPNKSIHIVADSIVLPENIGHQASVSFDMQQSFIVQDLTAKNIFLASQSTLSFFGNFVNGETIIIKSEAGNLQINTTVQAAHFISIGQGCIVDGEHVPEQSQQLILGDRGKIKGGDGQDTNGIGLFMEVGNVYGKGATSITAQGSGIVKANSLHLHSTVEVETLREKLDTTNAKGADKFLKQLANAFGARKNIQIWNVNGPTIGSEQGYFQVELKEDSEVQSASFQPNTFFKTAGHLHIRETLSETQVRTKGPFNLVTLNKSTEKRPVQSVAKGNLGLKVGEGKTLDYTGLKVSQDLTRSGDDDKQQLVLSAPNGVVMSRESVDTILRSGYFSKAELYINGIGIFNLAQFMTKEIKKLFQGKSEQEKNPISSKVAVKQLLDQLGNAYPLIAALCHVFNGADNLAERIVEGMNSGVLLSNVLVDIVKGINAKQLGRVFKQIAKIDHVDIRVVGTIGKQKNVIQMINPESGISVHGLWVNANVWQPGAMTQVGHLDTTDVNHIVSHAISLNRADQRIGVSTGVGATFAKQEKSFSASLDLDVHTKQGTSFQSPVLAVGDWKMGTLQTLGPNIQVYAGKVDGRVIRLVLQSRVDDEVLKDSRLGITYNFMTETVGVSGFAGFGHSASFNSSGLSIFYVKDAEKFVIDHAALEGGMLIAEGAKIHSCHESNIQESKSYTGLGLSLNVSRRDNQANDQNKDDVGALFNILPISLSFTREKNQIVSLVSTQSDEIPLDAKGNMNISRLIQSNRKPQAHKAFNKTILLPWTDKSSIHQTVRAVKTLLDRRPKFDLRFEQYSEKQLSKMFGFAINKKLLLTDPAYEREMLLRYQYQNDPIRYLKDSAQYNTIFTRAVVRGAYAYGIKAPLLFIYDALVIIAAANAINFDNKSNNPAFINNALDRMNQRVKGVSALTFSIYSFFEDVLILGFGEIAKGHGVADEYLLSAQQNAVDRFIQRGETARDISSALWQMPLTEKINLLGEVIGGMALPAPVLIVKGVQASQYIKLVIKHRQLLKQWSGKISPFQDAFHLHYKPFSFEHYHETMVPKRPDLYSVHTQMRALIETGSSNQVITGRRLFTVFQNIDKSPGQLVAFLKVRSTFNRKDIAFYIDEIALVTLQNHIVPDFVMAYCLQKEMGNRLNLVCSDVLMRLTKHDAFSLCLLLEKSSTKWPRGALTVSENQLQLNVWVLNHWTSETALVIDEEIDHIVMLFARNNKGRPYSGVKEEEAFIDLLFKTLSRIEKLKSQHQLTPIQYKVLDAFELSIYELYQPEERIVELVPKLLSWLRSSDPREVEACHFLFGELNQHILKVYEEGYAAIRSLEALPLESKLFNFSKEGAFTIHHRPNYWASLTEQQSGWFADVCSTLFKHEVNGITLSSPSKYPKSQVLGDAIAAFEKIDPLNQDLQHAAALLKSGKLELILINQEWVARNAMPTCFSRDGKVVLLITLERATGNGASVEIVQDNVKRIHESLAKLNMLSCSEGDLIEVADLTALKLMKKEPRFFSNQKLPSDRYHKNVIAVKNDPALSKMIQFLDDSESPLIRMLNMNICNDLAHGHISLARVQGWLKMSVSNRLFQAEYQLSQQKISRFIMEYMHTVLGKETEISTNVLNATFLKTLGSELLSDLAQFRTSSLKCATGDFHFIRERMERLKNIAKSFSAIDPTLRLKSTHIQDFAHFFEDYVNLAVSYPVLLDTRTEKMLYQFVNEDICDAVRNARSLSSLHSPPALSSST